MKFLVNWRMLPMPPEMMKTASHKPHVSIYSLSTYPLESRGIVMRHHQAGCDIQLNYASILKDKNEAYTSLGEGFPYLNATSIRSSARKRFVLPESLGPAIMLNGPKSKVAPSSPKERAFFALR